MRFILPKKSISVSSKKVHVILRKIGKKFSLPLFLFHQKAKKKITHVWAVPSMWFVMEFCTSNYIQSCAKIDTFLRVWKTNNCSTHPALSISVTCTLSQQCKQCASARFGPTEICIRGVKTGQHHSNLRYLPLQFHLNVDPLQFCAKWKGIFIGDEMIYWRIASNKWNGLAQWAQTNNGNKETTAEKTAAATTTTRS